MTRKLLNIALLSALALISLETKAQWNGVNPLWTNSDVGIGIATPTSMLHILQDQTTTGGGGFSDIFTVQYQDFSSTKDVFTISSTGKLGVGSSGPVSQFHILNNIGAATNTFEINKLYGANTHQVLLDSRFHAAYLLYNLGISSGDGGILYSDQQGTGGNNSSSGFFIGPRNSLLKKGLRFDEDGDLLVYGSLTVNDGTTNQFKISSNGYLHARQVDVNLTTIPDYVFEESYPLLPLNQLEKYINTNKHLPNIKSATEYEKEGSIDLGELSIKLLEKVEELTLHIISLNKRIEELESQKIK